MSHPKKQKISFLFNQVLTSEIKTGGEVRGKILADFFTQKSEFKTQIIAPKIAKNIFKGYSCLFIDQNKIETKLNQEKTLSSFILYFLRTLELVKNRLQIKTDVLYSTGDFFCNIIPSVFIKTKYKKTKLVVVIHHINDNPFKRKTTSFFTGLISYILQQFDLFLIKNHFDLIFVVNQQTKDYLIQKGFYQPIVVSYNGLNFEQIKKDTLHISKIKPQNKISYFGRVTTTKGSLDLPIILAKIKKAIPDIHLDIIGTVSPNIKNQLAKKFKDYHCQESYTLHNFISNKKDVYSILARSKAIIFPSYEEGWGISLFESIMSFRPVITYDLPVFQEIFNHQLATVPIGDTDKFSIKTISIIKKFLKPSTQNYINKCCQIVQKFNWQNTFYIEEKAINKLICNC